MSFTPTRQGNPCIHCGDTQGNCRTHKTREMHLCVSLSSSRKGERSQGYVVIGDTSDGRWAQLLPDNGLEFSLDKLEDLRREWQLHEEQARRERLGKEMPAVERDKYYRKILAQLTLNPEDKLDLTRRGFTDEQILKSGFKSVERWQNLDGFYPKNLPGINSQGNGLISHTPGYVCPITDCNGFIVGLQVRKRILLNGDNQRYYFLSQDSSIRIKDQVPLAVFPATNSSTIGLTEGVGVKPFLACERLGISVIGASGGNWASSPTHLKQSLEKLGATSGDAIAIFPDAGSVTNKAVLHQYTRTTQLLESWGYVVRFGWWGQSCKELADIDELPTKYYGLIRYLSVDEFKQLCAKWEGLLVELENYAAPIDFVERVARAQKKLHTLSYPADLICDPQQKYLPDLLDLVPLKGILALNSPKGSGKSRQGKAIKEYCCGYWLEKTIYPEIPEITSQQLNLLPIEKQKQVVSSEPITKERVWNPGLGMKFVSISARIALGRQQAIEWKFTYIEDADLKGSREQLGVTHLATETIIENINEIGLCADSLSKLKNRDWSKTLIVIDEVELVLNHISTSTTCRDKRSQILQVLEDKIRESLDNQGLLLLADADLSDVSLDYFQALTPNHIPYVVRHDFKGGPWQINYYTGRRDPILSQIEEHLSNPDCEPIALAMDNQSEAEAFSQILTSQYPYLKQEIGGLIRIDSKITQQDFGKNFVKRPNQSIQKYQPKILIYTPSMGTGCSIDVPWFKHVYGLFFGNLEPSQCRQMLARVRQPVPRTVWAKIRGGSAEDEITSYLPSEIKKRMFALHDNAMVSLETALTKARNQVIASGNLDPEDKDVLPILIETLQKMQGPDGSWNNPHIDLFCNQMARRNFSLSQLAVQMRQELIDEGHYIVDVVSDGTTHTGDLVSQTNDEIKWHNSGLTAIAEDTPFKDAQQLKLKAARTQEEEHKISKAFLKNDLPELELTQDFIYKAVYKDNRRWLNQTKLFWLLNNPKALASQDQKHWKAKLSQFSKGVTCLWDVKIDGPKIEAILKSGVLDWIKLDNLDVEYNSSSDEGKEFLKRCLSNKKQIKNAFGITVTSESVPISVANKILARFGLKLNYNRKNDAVRYYKLDEKLLNDPDRQAVFDALTLKWENEVTKMAETKAQQDKSSGHYSDNILRNNNSTARNNQPDEFTQESLDDAVELLQYCEDSETLQYLRAAIAPTILKEAAKLLSQEKAAQIRQWVINQNVA